MAKQKPKTASERKQAERSRLRQRGYVLRQLWVHPSDWAKVQKLAFELYNSRENAD